MKQWAISSPVKPDDPYRVRGDRLVVSELGDIQVWQNEDKAPAVLVCVVRREYWLGAELELTDEELAEIHREFAAKRALRLAKRAAAAAKNRQRRGAE